VALQGFKLDREQSHCKPFDEVHENEEKATFYNVKLSNLKKNFMNKSNRYNLGMKSALL
jgi:hypothetical protein